MLCRVREFGGLRTAEFETEIRRSVTAKLQVVSEIANNDWKLAAEKLFNRLSSTHLNAISAIDNPIKRAFYEMETIRGCWTVKELERQLIHCTTSVVDYLKTKKLFLH